MPTAMDPEQAVTTGLLGAAGPVQVTCGPCSFDFFDYTKKDGTVGNRTMAALISMSPEGEVDEAGNQKSYQQMYSIGDPKTHHPNPDKATFEGPLVKGSNFNFFLENLINAGFPKHLLASGDIRVLNGAVLVVEQKKPPTRKIAGKEDDTANKAQVVAVKVLHPAPGEDWPATGKPVKAAGKPSAKPAGAPKAAAPKAAAPKAAAHAPAATDNGEATIGLAEAIVAELIAEAGDQGYTAKDGAGSLSQIGKQATVKYMKKMQADSANFPPNLRASVVKLAQTPEWLADGARPWVYDEDSGILVAS